MAPTKGRKGFAANARMYRAFLVYFMEKPLFNQKYIMKALENVLKSEVSRGKAYMILKPCKNKVRSDIKILRADPEAFVESIEEFRSKTDDAATVEKEYKPNNTVRDSGKNNNQKLNSSELIDSIHKEIQVLKDKMKEYEKNCAEDDGDKVDISIPPVPGSVFIKDLEKLVSLPPLIDLTVDDEETDDKIFNNKNDSNQLEKTSQILQSPESLHANSCSEQIVTGIPMLTALLTQKVISRSHNQCEPIGWMQNTIPPHFNNSSYLCATPPPLFVSLPAGNFQIYPNFAKNSPSTYYQPTKMQQIRIDNNSQELNSSWPFTYYQ